MFTYIKPKENGSFSVIRTPFENRNPILVLIHEDDPIFKDLNMYKFDHDSNTIVKKSPIEIAQIIASRNRPTLQQRVDVLENENRALKGQLTSIIARLAALETQGGRPNGPGTG